MVKAVVFDLDDTLISERQYIESGYRHIADILSIQTRIVQTEIFSELIDLLNESPKNVFNRFYDKHNIEYSKDMILELITEYRGHLPEIQFYDDVVPCLNELKILGMKTGIITDGYAFAQQQKLKAIEANKYFEEIIVTDELGREYWKPHPKAFHLMRQKFEINFDEMIYIGDNPEKDFYISKIYPMKTVRILRNDNKYESIYKLNKYFKGVKENYRITNLIELVGLIDNF